MVHPQCMSKMLWEQERNMKMYDKIDIFTPNLLLKSCRCKFHFYLITWIYSTALLLFLKFLFCNPTLGFLYLFFTMLLHEPYFVLILQEILFYVNHFPPIMRRSSKTLCCTRKHIRYVVDSFGVEGMSYASDLFG